MDYLFFKKHMCFIISCIFIIQILVSGQKTHCFLVIVLHFLFIDSQPHGMNFQTEFPHTNPILASSSPAKMALHTISIAWRSSKVRDSHCKPHNTHDGLCITAFFRFQYMFLQWCWSRRGGELNSIFFFTTLLQKRGFFRTPFVNVELKLTGSSYSSGIYPRWWSMNLVHNISCNTLCPGQETSVRSATNRWPTPSPSWTRSSTRSALCAAAARDPSWASGGWQEERHSNRFRGKSS